MNKRHEPIDHSIPLDDQTSDMVDFVRSIEGEALIAQAQAAIDAGHGIVATDAYFVHLRWRIEAKRKA